MGHCEELTAMNAFWPILTAQQIAMGTVRVSNAKPAKGYLLLSVDRYVLRIDYMFCFC